MNKKETHTYLVKTIQKKFESLFEAGIIIFGLNAIWEILLKLKEHWQVILKWVGYIGAGAIIIIIVLGILYSYIKLNGLKYRKIKSKGKKK